MRAMETIPAASLNAGEKIALVGRAQVRVSHVAPYLKSVGGDRPLIGLSPLGTNEGMGSIFLAYFLSYAQDVTWLEGVEKTPDPFYFYFQALSPLTIKDGLRE